MATCGLSLDEVLAKYTEADLVHISALATIEGWGTEEALHASMAAKLANMEVMIEAMASRQGIRMKSKAKPESFMLSPPVQRAAKPRVQSWDEIKQNLS